MMDKLIKGEKCIKSIYYGNLDLYKFIAAIMIIFLHAGTLSSIKNIGGWYVTELVTRIAVPFFFMTSGFLSAHKFDVSKTNIQNQIRKLGRLYLYWSLIYLPVKLLVLYKDGLSSIQIYTNLIHTFVFSGMDTHLWYISALIVSFILLFVLIRIFNIEVILIISLVLYLFGCVFTAYNNLVTQIEIINLFDEIYKRLLIQYRNGLFFGLYFVSLGVYLRKKLENDDPAGWLKSKGILITTIIIYILELIFITVNKTYDNTYTDMRIALSVLIPLLFYRLITIKEFTFIRKNNLSYKLRNISFLIYANHILVYMIMKQILIRTPFYVLYNNSIIFFIIVLVTSVLLAKTTISISRFKCFTWLKELY